MSLQTSRNSEFRNSNASLRPRVPVSPGGRTTNNEPYYIVNSANFPELYNVFQEMGGEALGYQLAIVGGGNNNAAPYYNRRIIGIGLELLNNAGGLADIRVLMAHEIHHVQQRERNGGRDFPNDPVQRRYRESEADLAAACEAGSVDPVIDMLRRLNVGRSEDPNYPSLDNRIAILQRNRRDPCRAVREGIQ